MYCVYYNGVKVGEGKDLDWALEMIKMFSPPKGVTIKVTKEEKIFEYEKIN